MSEPSKLGRPPSEEPLVSRSFRLEDSTWENLGPNPRATLQQLARWFARKPGVKQPQRPQHPPES